MENYFEDIVQCIGEDNVGLSLWDEDDKLLFINPTLQNFIKSSQGLDFHVGMDASYLQFYRKPYGLVELVLYLRLRD